MDAATNMVFGYLNDSHMAVSALDESYLDQPISEPASIILRVDASFRGMGATFSTVSEEDGERVEQFIGIMSQAFNQSD